MRAQRGAAPFSSCTTRSPSRVARNARSPSRSASTQADDVGEVGDLPLDVGRLERGVADARDLDHGFLRFTSEPMPRRASRSTAGRGHYSSAHVLFGEPETTSPGHALCGHTACPRCTPGMLTWRPSTLRPGMPMKKISLVLLLALSAPALAQAPYPTRPITMVVPLPAGGTADLLCRFAADKARRMLGQQVVVENRPGGAGGRIGIEQVLRATARRLHAAVRDAAQLQHHASGVHEVGVRSAAARADQRARDLSADHHHARRASRRTTSRTSSRYAQGQSAARSPTAIRARPTPGICSAS